MTETAKDHPKDCPAVQHRSSLGTHQPDGCPKKETAEAKQKRFPSGGRLGRGSSGIDRGWRRHRKAVRGGTCVYEVEELGWVTTQDIGCARAWLRESTPGRRTGYELGVETSDGFSESSVDGKAREERYVDAVRYSVHVKRSASSGSRASKTSRQSSHSASQARCRSRVAP